MKTTAVVFAVVTCAALVAAACSNFSPEDDAPVDEAGAADADAEDTATNDANHASPDAPTGLGNGCSDGTREEFMETPNITACEGAWELPGIEPDAQPTCNRMAGNDSASSPKGCSAVDLCAASWHVCKGLADVAAHLGASPAGGPCGMMQSDPVIFWATAQETVGASCPPAGATGANDVIGCGTAPRPEDTCLPLNSVITSEVHPASFSFSGLSPNHDNERTSVVHGAGPGGVLCCSD